MLRRLSIRDFVIVDALDLDWSAGFTALTGETGAGKSILIDALQLALGQRADAGAVREGAAKAEITAEFDLPPALQAWLDEQGYDRNEGLLLLRRQVDASGKSRAWINGHAAPAAHLKAIADQVLDIHGQHAWQSLMRADAVRHLLDAHAQADTTAVQQAYRTWKQAHAAWRDAVERADALAREREGLAWQVGELRRLAPQPEEWLELEAEHRRLSHGSELLEGGQRVLDSLEGEHQSVQGQLRNALRRLDELVRHDAGLGEVAAVLRDAESLIEEASHGLRHRLEKTDLDPQRLAAVEERLSAWMGLARRLRRPPADLPALWQQWEDELSALEKASQPEALEQACHHALAAYHREAAALRAVRAPAARALAAEVTAAMQTLGMPGGRLDIELRPEEAPQAWGSEAVELLVAGHAGVTPRPLAKVASGGELSRIALAIAVCTGRAQAGGAATVIFDEVDAGVGGTVADTVGQLLRQLGAERQVLAVTHLAQVASCAHQHWVVRKSSDLQGTRSSVRPVDGEQRVAELARMLGGDRRSTSHAHAKSLLEDAQS